MGPEIEHADVMVPPPTGVLVMHVEDSMLGMPYPIMAAEYATPLRASEGPSPSHIGPAVLRIPPSAQETPTL
jgi:hypothetical protein